MNSNRSYGPETTKWGHDLCDLTFDLWPWPFAWTSCLSVELTPENFRMIRWEEHCQKLVTDEQTDGQTDGQMEISVLRAAWSQLKIYVSWFWFKYFCNVPGAWFMTSQCSFRQRPSTWFVSNPYKKQRWLMPTAYKSVINATWPTDAIWRHRAMSLLAEVMVYCLTAPNHHLNKCWLITYVKSSGSPPNDDVIKWKHFPRYWPFVRGIHRSRWIPRTKASDA